MRRNYYAKNYVGPVNSKNQFVNNIVNRSINNLIDYSIDSVRKKIGKEYMFQFNDQYFVIEQIIEKIIKKYDKNFNNHHTKGRRDELVITNQRFILMLPRNTFMYVATGNKIGNIEDRFLMSNSISSRDMYIYIFGKGMNILQKKIDKLIHDVWCNTELGIFTIDANSVSDYRGNISEKYPLRETMDVTYSKLSIRTLDTLFFSHNEKNKICNHINKFNDSKDFYMNKQLLYKTGILLCGEPGTGKSSFVKALASTYNRSIVNINMSNIKYIDLNKLTQSINVDEDRTYIILMEDIDTLFLNRKDDKLDKEDQAVVNKLLQFLDSNTSPTNVIFIATTNHIERLDEALLREGRFDLKVEIKALKEEECYEFGISFGLTKDQISEILSDIRKEFPERTLINQSLLQARILGKIENRSNDKVAEIYGVMKE